MILKKEAHVSRLLQKDRRKKDSNKLFFKKMLMLQYFNWKRETQYSRGCFTFFCLFLSIFIHILILFVYLFEGLFFSLSN